MLGRFRRNVGAAFADSFFRGISAAGRLHPNARPERHGLELIRDVRYRPGDGVDHHLDIYRPRERDGLVPVVLYIHGGGFRILSKDTHWIMGLAYGRRGMLVMNASYRLAPTHPFPAAIEDVCDAYAWAVENAERFGGDPTRIVLAGESAGANLVAALAVATCWERDEPWAKTAYRAGVVPSAVVPACGIFQVSDVDRFRRRKKGFPLFLVDRLVEIEEAYLRHRDKVAPEALDFADPLLFLERAVRPDRPLPPFFVPVGTKDPILDDTRRLRVALERLGAVAEARYYEGEPHAFHAMVFLPNARRCWGDIYAFLDQHVPTR